MKNALARTMATSKKNNTKILWYVVKTRPEQEVLFKDILENHIVQEGNIIEYYCPLHTTSTNFYLIDDGRREVNNILRVNKKGQRVMVKQKDYYPLFAGLVFVKSTEAALTNLLQKYYPEGTILYTTINGDSDFPKPLIVPDEQMERVKVFNESFPDDPLILKRQFDEYSFNHKTGEANDTVVVLDGPLKGRIGYIVRMGKDRSRGFAFETKNPFGKGNVTVGVSNIWNFHVARLHNASFDNSTIATKKSRAVDFLIGLIQGAGFTDKYVLYELYLIIEKLTKNNSFDELSKYLREKGEKRKNTGDLEDSAWSKTLAKSLDDASSEDLSLVLNLIRYENMFPGYVKDTYSKLIIRPFLTPSSGIKPVTGKDYALLEHRDFVEIIKPVEFTEKTYYPATKSGSDETVRYYAHVGIKRTNNGYVFFTNWDAFLAKFYLIGGVTREWLISKDKVDVVERDEKGYLQGKKTDSETQQKVKKAWDSFYNFDKPLYEAMAGIPPVNAVKNLIIDGKTINVMALQYETKTKRSIESALEDDKVKFCVNRLIDTCLNICTTMSRETHLKTWRGYLNTVWLHK